MKAYEAVFIFDSSLNEDQAGELKEKVSSLISQHEGIIHEVRYWGKRKFAYPIQKKKDGHYFLFIFDALETLPLELSHFTRVSETVLRGMIIRRIIRKSRQSKKEPIAVVRPDEEVILNEVVGITAEVDLSPEPKTEIETPESSSNDVE